MRCTDADGGKVRAQNTAQGWRFRAVCAFKSVHVCPQLLIIRHCGKEKVLVGLGMG